MSFGHEAQKVFVFSLELDVGLFEFGYSKMDSLLMKNETREQDSRVARVARWVGVGRCAPFHFILPSTSISLSLSSIQLLTTLLSLPHTPETFLLIHPLSVSSLIQVPSVSHPMRPDSSALLSRLDLLEQTTQVEIAEFTQAVATLRSNNENLLKLRASALTTFSRAKDIMIDTVDRLDVLDKKERRAIRRSE